MNHNIGDFPVRSGRGDDAFVYCRKALEMLNAPRYCEPIEAIAVWQEELKSFDKEWKFNTGETSDAVCRETDRLRGKLEG